MTRFIGRELQYLAEYDFDGRNEAEISGDWIETLLRLLGYGPSTRHEIRRQQDLPLRPPTRMVGSHRIKIDFVPTVFGRRLWIIEAKRPQEDLFAIEHIGQAWTYATDPRVNVPLMALCDGTRFAVFDLTRERWDDPEYDHPNADLPQHFNELFALLGAPCIAETIRRRQLGHLRRALEAQVDLGALDRTHTDVLEMIDAVRPIVLERREDHRRAGREHMAAESRSVLDAAGMWGHAQRLNRPHFIGHWGELERAVEFVRRQPPSHRIREFDDIERATIPRGAEQTRMWFPLRALRLGTAVLLSEEEGCGDYCREVARVAARQHAAGFADDPLLAASYRLQRLLGPLGWRLAARTKRSIDHDAAALAASLEAEEWLRLDGALGITSPDNFKRFAQLASARILRQVDPWTIDQVTERADEAEALLDRLGTPDGFEELLSATDPWLQSWLTGDP